MDEKEMSDFKLRGLRHDDHSSENQNDNMSSGYLEAVYAQKAVGTAHIGGQVEQLRESSGPLAPERERKIGKCNLRKSLAWNSAFFTSEGILEPDELSSMINGATDKGGKHFLSGIEEDIHRSISTLETESLTLENLEVDLFEDVRASIQKSNKASNKGSSNKAASGETDTVSICPLKKADPASKNTMKLKPVSKKQTMVMHGPGRLAKQSSGSQGPQPVASTGGLISSIPKTPKVIASHNPTLSAPLRRASLDVSKIKQEKEKAKGSSVVTFPGKVGPVSKLSGLGGPLRTVPKPTPSSKSPSLGVNGGKCMSPVKSSKRRIDSRTCNPVFSSAILKNPSTVPVKKKGQAQLFLPNRSSNASPDSSFSEWSSVSSSSASTVNQKSSSSRVSIDSSSHCRSLNSVVPPALENHSPSNDQISIYQHNGAPSRPATVQPTGLRMPSPKLGYFDAVKPVDRTRNVSTQSYSGIPPRPKIGAPISNPNGLSSKANNTRLQPTRTAAAAAATGNLKLDSNKKPALPVPLPKPLNSQKVVCEEGLSMEKTNKPSVSKSAGQSEKEENIKSDFILQQFENNWNSLCQSDEIARCEDRVEVLGGQVVGGISTQEEVQNGN